MIVGPGGSSAAGNPRGGSGDRQPLYIVLGDSWAAGVGASAPSEGYVPQVHAALQRKLHCRTGPGRRRGCQQLALVNLAQTGATTPSLTRHSCQRRSRCSGGAMATTTRATTCGS